MKFLVFTLLSVFSTQLSFSQNTTAPPVIVNQNNNAVTNNSVNNNNGTPMVKNPVENNNPSVQAAIPINNKPASLENDLPNNNNNIPANRIVNDNSQKNVPVKNKTVSAVQGKPGINVVNNIPNDTIKAGANFTNNLPAVESTTIYTGTDQNDVTKPVPIKKIITSTGTVVPVLQTYVSEDVVNKFKRIYGNNLYDIRLVRSVENKYKYLVRIQDNGTYKTIYLDEEGVIIQ